MKNPPWHGKRTFYLYTFCSKFQESYRVKTPEEGQRVERPIHCEYNEQDEHSGSNKVYNNNF